jgi:BNR repeat-containing family member
VPLVRRPRRRGGSRRPIAIGSVAVAALLLLGAGLAVRRDTASGEAAATRFSRAPEIARLPGRIGLEGWNSATFADDNVWTEEDRQFAVWVDDRGRPIVGRREGPEGTWRTFDLGALPGNPLGAPTAPDAHRVYVVAVDRAGYVHVAGNMHADPLRYVRSERPFDVDSWVRPGMVGADERSVTYPTFVRAPDGDLLFFYRDGTAGHGDVLLNRLDRSTGRWQRVGVLVEGRSSGESPYLQHVAVDRERGNVHVVFLWRAGNGADTNRDVSYLRSPDSGRTWQASDGSPRSLPVTHRTAEVVAPTTSRSPTLLNQGALAVDPSGQPHAVFLVRRGGSAKALHVWHDAGRWRAEPLVGLRRPAGRPALVGDGREPLLLLWAERRDDDELDLRAAGLDGPRTIGSFSLSRLGVGRWEPTVDDAAVASGRLRMLLPLRRAPGSRNGADAAVVTWPLAALR